MRYKLSPQITGEINSFLRQISVAHGFDEEIREELHCHIEDKLIGYVKGNIKITEEEAWILVKEHFGNPAVLKNLYLEVEAKAMYMSFFRRIGAAFVVCMWLMFIAPPLLNALFTIISNTFLLNNPLNYFTTIIYCAGLSVPVVLPVILMFYIFFYWRKKMNNNEATWFETIKGKNFIKLIIVSFIVTITVKMLFENENFRLIPWHKVTFADSVIENFFNFYGVKYIYIYLYGIIPPLVSCLAWLWWCDNPPKRFLMVFYGFITWMAAQILIIKTFVFMHTVCNPIFYTSSFDSMYVIKLFFWVVFSSLRLEFYFRYGGIALAAYCIMYFAYTIMQRKDTLMTPAVK